MRLHEWMTAHGLTNQALARDLGCGLETVRLLRCGRSGKEVSARLADGIFARTGGAVTAADIKAAYISPEEWRKRRYAVLRREAMQRESGVNTP